MRYSQMGGALLLCGAMAWAGSSQAQPPAPLQVPRADGKGVDVKPREEPRTPAESIDRQLEQLSKTMMLLTPEMKRAEETLKKFPAPSPCASSDEKRQGQGQAQGYGSGGRKQGFGRIVEISPKATKEPPLKAKENPNGGGASKDGKVG